MRSNHCVVAGVVAMTVGGCILRAGDGESRERDGTPPAADGSPTADSGPDPLGPFGPATVVPVSDPAAFDDDPSLTGDGRELYFDSDRPGSAGQGDIFLALRSASGELDPPSPVAELASPSDDTGFRVTTDGLAIVFASNRPGGLGGRDIWISTRTDRSLPWGDPAPRPELNSTAAEAGPSLDDAGRRIVFSSSRDRVTDLYIATRANATDPFDPPVPLDELNTDQVEDGAMLSPDGLTITFYSNRDGDDDLYIATRDALDQPFGDPVPIAELNSDASDVDLWISEDRRRVLFSSDRSGNSEIYEATR